MFLDEHVCFRFQCLCSTAQGTCSPESFPVPRRLSPEMDRTAQNQGAAREGSRRPQQGGPRSQGMARLCLGIITRTDTIQGPSVDDGSTCVPTFAFPIAGQSRPCASSLFALLLAHTAFRVVSKSLGSRYTSLYPHPPQPAPVMQERRHKIGTEATPM